MKVLRINGAQRLRLFAVLVAFLVANASSVFGVDIEPFGIGPMPVGTTNMEVGDVYVNISSPEMNEYLTRTRPNGQFLTDILKHKNDSFIVEVDVPNYPALYGATSGTRIAFSAFVAYPTSEDNDRPSYQFPHVEVSDGVFERMQAPGEGPIFHNPGVRYPLVVLSHGGGVHSLFEVGHAKTFASHGYIAVAICHGDGAVDLSRNEFYGLRPLAVKAVLDRLLESDDFGPHIDSRRIGITGHSWGGLTALAAGGAKIFNDPQAVTDDRITAIVGLEPSITNSFGGSFRRTFGTNNEALAAIDKPYLHINGTVNSFPYPTVDLVSGTTYYVSLPGQPHVFQSASWSDTLNWELVFFGAYLKNDPLMLELLNTADSVAGFNRDFQNMSRQKLRPIPAPTLVESFGSANPMLVNSFQLVGGQPTSTVAFLESQDASSELYYDLQYLSEESEWLTLSSNAVSALAGVPDSPSGFSWSALTDPLRWKESMETRFYRVRVSGRGE